MNKFKHSCRYKSFNVSGTIVQGDWEGDPSVVPHGVNYLDPYVINLCICTDDEEDYCGIDVFTVKFEDDCADALIESWRES